MRKVAGRLCEALESHLRLSDAEASRVLGYSSTSMLSNVRTGITLPDPERLLRLSALRTPSGQQVDLHWLLTGEGAALREPEDRVRVGDLRRRAVQAVASADEATLQLTMLVISRR